MATSRTYTTTQCSRATAEFGSFSNDGTIEWSIVGTSEGLRVDERGTRTAECALDWERIHAVRVGSGWTLVSS